MVKKNDNEAKPQAGKTIGIDLGTTFSAVAIMEGGKPVIIPNAEGGRITPSVVHIKDGEITVGVSAKNLTMVEPENTVRSIKRLMGSNEKVTVNKKDYTPQEISAMILQKLKKDAEGYLGTKITNAVITVPAYFNDAQRQATKDAGKIAGLNVLRIINEPTAASLAYGLEKTNDHTILVFDFGGGTFDVSILELGDGVFEVKATSGNNHLGGDDIDEKIMDWLIDKFKKDQGIDLRKDPHAMQRLKDAAEKSKIELSQKMKVDVNIPYITADARGPKHLNYELTRAKFEELIVDIIEALKKPTLQALKDSGLDIKDINKVIFVGGSTRIPKVQDLVKDITGKPGDKSVNPDEAVAVGAAIQAGVLGGEVKDILLLDVTPLTLGIETLGGVCTPLIQRNTTIPTKKSQIFSTAADSQTAVTINVLQGERPMATDNKSLGRFDLLGIPPAPRGIPQIEVTFDIDANGIVSVSAKDLGTGKEQKIQITGSSNLNSKDIERMQKEAEQHAEEDKKTRELIETENQADSILYTAKKQLEEFKDQIDSKMKEEIEADLKELESAKEKKDVDEMNKAMENLNKKLMEIGQKIYQEAQAKQGAAGQAGETDESEEEHEEHDHKHSHKKNEKVEKAEFKEKKKK